jgi:hypothetical protein
MNNNMNSDYKPRWKGARTKKTQVTIMNMNTMSSANRHNNETGQQHLSPCIHIRF